MNNSICRSADLGRLRGYIVAAQKQVAVVVNSAMVEAYWNIGKRIYEACGKNERAAFGIELDPLSQPDAC